MISVRRNIFETNSSSTHSITMCSEDEYDKWKNGELLYERWEETFYAKEQIIEIAKEKKNKYLKEKEEGKTIHHYQEEYLDAVNEEELYEVECNNGDYYEYNKFWDDIDYETFATEYTTEKGEKIIAFGYYGYDG